MLFQIFLWCLTGFLLGSIPFALLLGQLLCKKDIRTFGDGNPGAYNAWHTGGWKIGMLAVLLDVGKGILPIYFARLYGGLPSWSLLLVALSPVLGHVFSPFLHFHGGKAVAASLGVWLVLAGLYGIIAFALFVGISSLIQKDHAWYVINGMLGLTAFLLITHAAPWIIAAALMNSLLLAYTHHRELSQPIEITDNVRNLLARGKE